MSWTLKHNHEGIPFGITSVDGLTVDFDVENAETIKAIQAHDPRIFTILDWATRNAESIFLSKEAETGGWWIWERENSLDEFERKCRVILASEFATDNIRRQAQSYLDDILEKRRIQGEKRIKEQAVRRRRAQFAGQYERLLLALIDRDGYRCAHCGAYEDLTIDHIMPLSKGGTDDLDNLRLLCRACNSSKGDKTE